MTPKSHQQVAERIAHSWTSGTQNFVIVAPPLTLPDSVFLLLNDEDFLSRIGIPIRELSIATVADYQFANSEQFVKRICSSWEVPAREGDVIDHLDVLEHATEVICDSGKRPVILLPRFHKALEKLSWSLGARLRELEHQYGLSTVVEIPIPLSRLRDRWENISSKEDFICSDFGQGHLRIDIGPMSKREIESELLNQGAKKEWAEQILEMTGGLPGLVKWLSAEASSISDARQLDVLARNGAKEHMKRFVQWLDAPGSDYFAQSIAGLYVGIATGDELATIKQHDWTKLLVNRRGDLIIKLLGVACTQTGKFSEVTHLRNVVAQMIAARRYLNVTELIDRLPEPHRTDERFALYDTLAKVLFNYEGISPDWGGLKKKLSSARQQCAQQSLEQIPDSLTKCLKELEEFVCVAVHWNQEVSANSRSDWRLGDCLCGRDNHHEKSSVRAALQFVAHKLEQAELLGQQDHGAAYKAILEIPEQILQMYCSLALDLPIWSCPELDELTLKQINELWKGSDFKKPRIGARMGFNDLLYVGWGLSRDRASEEQLMPDEEDILHWNSLYTSLRSQAAHSTIEITRGEWIRYLEDCDRLFSRLCSVLNQGERADLLPPIKTEIERFLASDNYL